MKSVFAVLPTIAASACPDCHFDLTLLEEFTSTWETRTQGAEDTYDASTGTYTATTQVPQSFPGAHGTLAVHARNLQLRFDSDAHLPEGFTWFNVPLGGSDLHEELHIDGVNDRASYHVSSPVLSMCVLLDAPAGTPSLAQMGQDQINQHLQQAEQVAPQMVQQVAATGTVDGVDSFALVFPPGSQDPRAAVAFTMDSHPLWIWTQMEPQEIEFYMDTVRPAPDRDELQTLGLYFTGYSSGVGNAFDTRACTIEGHNAAMTMLSSNPDMRAFAKHRIREHTANLQQLLQNPSLNTRYNFLNMDLADKLFPEESNCGSVLAETVNTSNSVNVVALSFVAGLTTAAFAFVAHLKFKKNIAVIEQDSPYSVM